MRQCRSHTASLRTFVYEGLSAAASPVVSSEARVARLRQWARDAGVHFNGPIRAVPISCKGGEYLLSLAIIGLGPSSDLNLLVSPTTADNPHPRGTENAVNAAPTRPVASSCLSSPSHVSFTRSWSVDMAKGRKEHERGA